MTDGRPVPTVSPAPPHRSVRVAVGTAVAAVAVVVAAVAAALGGHALRPAEAVARSVIVVAGVDDEASAERALRTQILMIAGPAVLGPVAARFGTSVDELAERVSAEASTDAGLVTLEVRAGTPDDAVRLAEAVVDHYLQLSYAADPPADGVVRSRLLIPPALPARDENVDPVLVGAAVGLLGAAGAAVRVATQRRKRAVR